MRVLYSFAVPASLGPLVCAVSSFDGVDQLHHLLAARTAERAAREHLAAAALLLWQDGSSADGASARAEADLTLTTLEERLILLADLRLFDTVIVMPLRADCHTAPSAPPVQSLFSALSIRRLLLSEGEMEPDALALARHAQQAGIQVEQVRPAGAATHVAPATIRRCIEDGEVERVSDLLGHPYIIRGNVVHGDKRGRILGFPTANLVPDPRKASPRNGIYAVRVRLPGETETRHPAVTSIGIRPTFGSDNRKLIEVFLLDAQLDLYGSSISIDCVAYLRDEQRFESIEALKAQMVRDVEQARERLALVP